VSTHRVWAPQARSVDLVHGDTRVAMTRGAGGWWSAASPEADADYAFSIDGGPPRPDPRSPWQPHGPHGPSRRVDHSRFAWTDAGWRPPALADGLVYEMHVGTFSPEGTFDGAAQRLDHLAALGVTHLELMPVVEGPGRRGWGYDGVDLYAPHHAYGGPDGLKRLVDACHARGLAVLVDVVYNHLGPSGNYLGELGPYFTSRHLTPWGTAVNLDGADSDEVRRFFLDNAVMWLRDDHADGLRLDAVHALHDESAVHFLEELASVVASLERELGRRLVLVAESDLNDPRLLRPAAQGGYGLHAQWNDDFHHALHGVLTGERTGYYEDFGAMADLAKAFRNAYVYDGRYSVHRGRRHGRPPDGLSGHAFFAYMQTHDQIGNRARGERSTHLLSPGRLRIAAALVLLSPFVPMLFQGEEWGARTPFPYFTDHDDPVLGESVREGRRREFAAFGWRPDEIPDPQAESTFALARLDWTEPAREPHASLLAWHRDLVRLRRETPRLRDGDRARVHVRFDEAGRWIDIERGPITLAANLAAEPRRLTLPSEGRVRLASDDGVRRSGTELLLPPDSVAVLDNDRGQ
jgi:maltooligosyltrehalose trehalohydrolase